MPVLQPWHGQSHSCRCWVAGLNLSRGSGAFLKYGDPKAIAFPINKQWLGWFWGPPKITPFSDFSGNHPHPTTWRWLFSFLGSVDDAIRATCHGFHGCVPCPPKSNVWLRMVKVCTVWVEVGYTRWGPPDNKQHDWKQLVSNRNEFKLWLLGKGPSNISSLSLSPYGGPKFGTPKWDGLLLKKKTTSAVPGSILTHTHTEIKLGWMGMVIPQCMGFLTVS